MIKVVKQPDPNATPKLDEHVIVENYLYGDFKSGATTMGSFQTKRLKQCLPCLHLCTGVGSIHKAS